MRTLCLALLLPGCQAFLASDGDRNDGGVAAPSGPFESEVFASVGPSPRLLAMNATHLYVVGERETIERVNKDTRLVEPQSTVTHGVLDKPITVTALVADSSSLFLTSNEASQCGAPAVAWKSPVGDAGKFVELGRHCGTMTAAANDPIDFVYAVGNSSNGLFWIYLVSVMGSSVRPVASFRSPSTALFTTPADIYVVSGGTRRITRLPKSDAGVDVATTNAEPVDLVADNERVYWIEADGHVATKARGAAPEDAIVTVTREAPGLAHLAQDKDRLYFTNSAEGTVRTVLKAGGVSESIASEQAKPLAIAVDASGVYWLNAGSATVMRARRR